MSTVVKDLGGVTAYADAVAAGYTGTREEYQELMASYATVAEQAAESAEAAAGSASDADSAKRDAVAAKTAAETAQGKAEDAKTAAETAQGLAEDARDLASGYASDASSAKSDAVAAKTAAETAQGKAEDAQGAAETAESHASGYADDASGSATAASGSASDASASALKSEGFAVGQQNGADVASGSPYYHNNAKYYSEQAAIEANKVPTPTSGTDDGKLLVADGNAYALGTNIDELLRVDGYSELAGVGYSDTTSQIISQIAVENKQPYLLRSTAASADTGGNRKNIRKIIGADIAWNQLVRNGNFANTDYWGVENAAFTVSNNIGTFKGTTSAGRIYNMTPLIAGHRYLKTGTFKLSSAPSGNAWLRLFLGNDQYDDTFLNKNSTDWQTVTSVATAASTSTGTFIGLRDNSESDWVDIQVKEIMLIDLDLMFNTAIATAIATKENTEAGSGIAWIRSYGFLTEDYYPYNAGSLLNVKTSAHITRDADDNIIGNYPLSNTDLHGILKYDELTDTIYADGDEYPPSGEEAVRYGIVDLGTLDWGYFPTGSTVAPYFFTSLPDCALPTNLGVGIPNIKCTSYVTTARNVSVFVSGCVTTDNYSNTTQIQIRNSSKTDADLTDDGHASWLEGVYLVYELATPTTASLTPYPATMLCEADGTEQFVDERTIPMPVPNEAFYQADNAMKLDRLPFKAANDGHFLIGQQDGMMTLIPVTAELPAIPAEDGNYNLKLTKSGSTVTLSWEAIE